jgi:phage FluMu protein Com
MTVPRVNSGFEIICLACNKPGGEIAPAQIDGKAYIALRCPHCLRMVASPVSGNPEWKEVVRRAQ